MHEAGFPLLASPLWGEVLFIIKEILQSREDILINYSNPGFKSTYSLKNVSYIPIHPMGFHSLPQLLVCDSKLVASVDPQCLSCSCGVLGPLSFKTH